MSISKQVFFSFFSISISLYIKYPVYALSFLQLVFIHLQLATVMHYSGFSVHIYVYMCASIHTTKCSHIYK